MHVLLYFHFPVNMLFHAKSNWARLCNGIGISPFYQHSAEHELNELERRVIALSARLSALNSNNFNAGSKNHFFALYRQKTKFSFFSFKKKSIGKKSYNKNVDIAKLW